MVEGLRIIRAIEITVFSHATEDVEKVKKAVEKLLPNSLKLKNFETIKLTGHYNDPILFLTLRVENKKESNAIVNYLFYKLSTLNQQTILDELPNRVDASGNLYLRLDKQKAYRDKLVLTENDPIRIKIKSQLPHKSDPVKIYRQYLLNLINFGEISDE